MAACGGCKCCDERRLNSDLRNRRHVNVSAHRRLQCWIHGPSKQLTSPKPHFFFFLREICAYLCVFTRVPEIARVSLCVCSLLQYWKTGTFRFMQVLRSSEISLVTLSEVDKDWGRADAMRNQSCNLPSLPSCARAAFPWIIRNSV